MPGPTTRAELIEEVVAVFEKLRGELDAAGPRAGSLPCVDAWSVKDLLAVRCWWTERVVDWIEAGKRGELPVTPAEGFSWRETPRLNDEIVHGARRESYRSLRARLEQGFERVLHCVDELDDRELLTVAVFEWAGKYPLARWLSLNTTRQHVPARTLLRRALRERAG